MPFSFLLRTADFTLLIRLRAKLHGNRFGCFLIGLATDAVPLQSPPLPHKSNMNGTERKSKSLSRSVKRFELMKRILFQPFDLKKWLVIGFAAWLANLGGVGGFQLPL